MRHLPHTVTVTPRTRSRDASGAPVWTNGTPVRVRAVVQPVTTTESYELGLTTQTVYRVLTPDPWPGGVHSVIEWGGVSTWEQIGQPKRHTVGRGTRHVEVLIQTAEAEVR